MTRTIQVSVQYDTHTVTDSVMLAMAACNNHINTDPSITEIIEIDVWEEGFIIASYGFTPVVESLAEIEAWIREAVDE